MSAQGPVMEEWTVLVDWCGLSLEKSDPRDPGICRMLVRAVDLLPRPRLPDPGPQTPLDEGCSQSPEELRCPWVVTALKLASMCARVHVCMHVCVCVHGCLHVWMCA